MPEQEINRYPVVDDDRYERNEVLLRCGTGSGLSLPTEACATDNGLRHPLTLVVGSVNLNTEGMHKSTVKIEFSSIINFRAKSPCGGYLLRLVFQLSRSCNKGTKVPLASWVYEKEVDVILELPGPETVNQDFKDFFGFNWCECDECPGCCTYLVEIVDYASDYISSASITNVGISALAV